MLGCVNSCVPSWRLLVKARPQESRQRQFGRIAHSSQWQWTHKIQLEDVLDAVKEGSDRCGISAERIDYWADVDIN
jgi:hypothetical protein